MFTKGGGKTVLGNRWDLENVPFSSHMDFFLIVISLIKVAAMVVPTGTL